MPYRTVLIINMPLVLRHAAARQDSNSYNPRLTLSPSDRRPGSSPPRAPARPAARPIRALWPPAPCLRGSQSWKGSQRRRGRGHRAGTRWDPRPSRRGAAARSMAARRRCTQSYSAAAAAGPQGPPAATTLPVLFWCEPHCCACPRVR